MSSEMTIFDRALVRRHRDRAARLVQRVRPVLEDVAERLIDRIDDTTRRFSRALDIGGRGVVAPLLRQRGIEVVCCDLSEAMLRAGRGATGVVADEEALPFAPGGFDLVVANLALHWVNDLPGSLIQIRQSLAPDGLFLASLPILGTLAELRAALADAEIAMRGGVSPRVSPFPDLRDCAGLLQRAGFALPVADGETIELLYADPMLLLRDLRAAGETNAVLSRERRPAPPSLLSAAVAALRVRDGRCRATLRLAFLTGWAPGPGQPQPKARGSATVSLAQALNGRSDTGETPG